MKISIFLDKTFLEDLQNTAKELQESPIIIFCMLISTILAEEFKRNWEYYDEFFMKQPITEKLIEISFEKAEDIYAN